MQVLGWQQKQKAYLALRAVLHALRDRLTVDEVAQLGAQLPMLIRGVFYEGWDPTDKPLPSRRRDQFLSQIAKDFVDDDVDSERVARAVFALLADRITEEEIEDVMHVLPPEFRELWP